MCVVCVQMRVCEWCECVCSRESERETERKKCVWCAWCVCLGRESVLLHVTPFASVLSPFAHMHANYLFILSVHWCPFTFVVSSS